MPNDQVNHPSHYTQGDIECIDTIRAALTPEQFTGFLKGQIIKYTWRSGHKGDPVVDQRKAAFYNKQLILHLADISLQKDNDKPTEET